MEELLLVLVEGEDIEMQRNDAACVIRAGTQSEESSRKYDFFGTARSAGPHGWWHEEDGF